MVMKFHAKVWYLNRVYHLVRYMNGNEISYERENTDVP